MTTTEKKPAEPVEQKLTASEVVQSLTGFDEIAIEQKFGDDISVIGSKSVGKFGRALGFILLRRSGMKDAEALTRVQGMTRAEVDELFANESDADLPGSEAGKDGS